MLVYTSIVTAMLLYPNSCCASDVALHGNSTAVSIGTEDVNASPRLLAEIIQRQKEYKKGEKIRLLSCSTGKYANDEYCFAEELSNILGVGVLAPTDTLFISDNGMLKVGDYGESKFELFTPNQRKRRK